MARKHGEKRRETREEEDGRARGERGRLWMSGRQCRDAKGGIEVSLAPRGGGEQSGMSE